ncbi:MBOAT family O-acyltransferase, partial [Bacillus velezensis]|uniref:MBOAT family O-acyltransferase n=1 Tax=Bacillus velezensis TaxID=492670 RepID=UPI0024BDCBB1
YSAFAAEVSRIMGIQRPINFNRPFASGNIKDFWNDWHISLSFWFRDYVYMRFVLWMTKKKWLKNKFAISYIGFFLLFFLMGIWHGPEWH